MRDRKDWPPELIQAVAPLEAFLNHAAGLAEDEEGAIGALTVLVCESHGAYASEKGVPDDLMLAIHEYTRNALNNFMMMHLMALGMVKPVLKRNRLAWKATTKGITEVKRLRKLKREQRRKRHDERKAQEDEDNAHRWN